MRKTYIAISYIIILFSVFANINTLLAQNTENYATDGDFYFFEGLRLYNLDNPVAAENAFRKALEFNSGNDAAYYYLHKIYLNKGDVDTAEKYLQEAASIDEGNYWYRIQLAQLYANTGRPEVALRLFEKLKSDFPKKTSLYFEMIYLYVREEQLDKALETLDHIQNHSGETEPIAMTRYDLLNMQGKNTEAIEYIIDYGQSHPSPGIAYLIGDIYANQYKDSLALDSYIKAINLDPTYSPPYLGAAEIYRLRRDYSKYFEYINPFILDGSIVPDMKVNYLKQIVYNVPQFVSAFRPQVDIMMGNLYTTYPKDTSVAYFAGAYAYQTGDVERAVDIYRVNNENHPEERRVAMEYLLLLYHLERWEDVIVLCDRLLEKYPDDIDFIQIKGIAFWRNDDIDKAISLYERLVKLSDPKSAVRITAYSSLGDMYHQKGENKKSSSYYDKVLKINPDYLPALNNYAYYLSLEGKKLKKALEMSEKTIKAEPNNATYLDTYGWILFLSGRNEEAKAVFKHAMIYGGKESAVIMDHYAEVLYSLGEKALAKIYWNNGHQLDPSLGLDIKAQERK